MVAPASDVWAAFKASPRFTQREKDAFRASRVIDVLHSPTVKVGGPPKTRDEAFADAAAEVYRFREWCTHAVYYIQAQPPGATGWVDVDGPYSFGEGPLA